DKEVSKLVTIHPVAVGDRVSASLMGGADLQKEITDKLGTPQDQVLIEGDGTARSPWRISSSPNLDLTFASEVPKPLKQDAWIRAIPGENSEWTIDSNATTGRFRLVVNGKHSAPINFPASHNALGMAIRIAGLSAGPSGENKVTSQATVSVENFDLKLTATDDNASPMFDARRLVKGKEANEIAVPADANGMSGLKTVLEGILEPNSMVMVDGSGTTADPSMYSVDHAHATLPTIQLTSRSSGVKISSSEGQPDTLNIDLDAETKFFQLFLNNGQRTEPIARTTSASDLEEQLRTLVDSARVNLRDGNEGWSVTFGQGPRPSLFGSRVLPAQSASNINGGATVIGLSMTTGVSVTSDIERMKPVEVFDAGNAMTGLGDDVTRGSVDDDHIASKGGHNVLIGKGGKDNIQGGGGADLLYGGDGSDSLSGNNGNDRLIGGPDGDSLNGGPDNDQLHGGPGQDVVFGGEGSDALFTSRDVDVLDGGPGNDVYRLTGDWTLAHIVERKGEGGPLTQSQLGEDHGPFVRTDEIRYGDTLDFSGVQSDYTHILSDRRLVSVPGLFDENGTLDEIYLKDSQENLKGRNPSTGRVELQLLGFAPGQLQKGKGNIELSGTSSFPNKLEHPVTLRVHFRVGANAGHKDVTISEGEILGTTEGARRGQNIAELLTSKLSVVGSDETFRLTAESFQAGFKLILELTNNNDARDQPETFLAVSVARDNVVAIENESLGNIESIIAPPTDNTFLFGNEYWGGDPASAGSLAGNVGNVVKEGLLNSSGLFQNIRSALPGKSPALRIDTSRAEKLVLDFRAVSQELDFEFNNESDGHVSLTVVKKFNFTVPSLPGGKLLPNLKADKLVFTHVDQNTTIYGGRGAKNTFNVPLQPSGKVKKIFSTGGSTPKFLGKIIGGTGVPGIGVATAAGFVNAALSTASALDPFDLVQAGRIQNILNYSGANSDGLQLLEDSLNIGAGGIASQDPITVPRGDFRIIHASGGANVFGEGFLTGIGPGFLTGAAGLRQSNNTFSLNRTEYATGFNTIQGITGFQVGKGINVLSGSNARVNRNSEQVDFDLGADTFTIGGSNFEPGIHLLAGGSGPDTYAFETGFWGVSAIFEPLDVRVVGASVEWPDTLDFSKTFKDLHFHVYEISTDNISDWQEILGLVSGQAGVGFGPVSVGMNIVLATTGEDFFDVAEGDTFFRNLASKLTDAFSLDTNILLATDIENIVGGPQTNTIHFHGNARIQGTINTAAGGNVVLDYSDFSDFLGVGDNSGITADLAAGLEGSGIPAFDVLPGLTSFLDPGAGGAQSLAYPGYTFQFGQADGVLGSRVNSITEVIDRIEDVNFLANNAVANASDVVGTSNDDQITGSSGDNVFFPNGGRDILDGKAGSDTLSYRGATVPVVVDSSGSEGNVWYEDSRAAQYRKFEISHDATTGHFKLQFTVDTYIYITGIIEHDASAENVADAIASAFEQQLPAEAVDINVVGDGTSVSPWLVTILQPTNLIDLNLLPETLSKSGAASVDFRVRRPVVPVDDFFQMRFGQSAKQLNVMANDFAPGGQAFFLECGSIAPTKGTVRACDHSISYVPDNGATGVDSFDYTIR
ncbi:MAG: calcium-binding protein, partial [Planctomycetota bacterium]